MFNINLEEAELEFNRVKENTLDYTKDLDIFESLNSVQTTLDIMVCKGASDSIIEGALLLEHRLLNVIVKEKERAGNPISIAPENRTGSKSWNGFILSLKSMWRSAKRKIGIQDNELKDLLKNLERKSQYRNPPEGLSKVMDFINIIINAGNEYQTDVLDPYNKTWDKYYEVEKDLNKEQFYKMHRMLGPLNKDMDDAEATYDDLHKIFKEYGKLTNNNEKPIKSGPFLTRMQKKKKEYDTATERVRMTMRLIVKELQGI